MAITNSLISLGQTTAIFTATNDSAITTMIFCNTDTVDDLLTVYVVGQDNLGNPSTVGPATTILYELPLPASETFTLDTEKLILSAGDTIYAQSSATPNVAATISSVNI